MLIRFGELTNSTIFYKFKIVLSAMVHVTEIKLNCCKLRVTHNNIEDTQFWVR